MRHAAPVNVIKGFVRSTLGCSCPDDIFSDIEYRKHVKIPNCQLDVTKILVGQRLLVFVVFADNGAALLKELPGVIVFGKRERDLYGYNRFRLVVATDGTEAIGPLAQEAFRNSQILDEKIHLHVVSGDEVAKLYESVTCLV